MIMVVLLMRIRLLVSMWVAMTLMSGIGRDVQKTMVRLKLKGGTNEEMCRRFEGSK